MSAATGTMFVVGVLVGISLSLVNAPYRASFFFSGLN
jgi:hypothetical protein